LGFKKNKLTMIIAIDFDNTITKGPGDYPDIPGTLRPYADKVIKRLISKGHHIIIWTCRSELDEIIPMLDYLDNLGIKPYRFNQNVPTQDNWPKIYADIYIDDRCLGGLPDWLTIEKMINEHESNNTNKA